MSIEGTVLGEPKIKWEHLEDKLGSWAEKIKPFWEICGFDPIFKFLKEKSSENRVICPVSNEVFRTFKETPMDTFRVLFLLQDPYHQFSRSYPPVMLADGIAMSCSHTGKCQPSLELFYNGMQDDLKIDIPHQPDLSYLAHQGVMFLNTSLTVEKDKPNSHQGIWDKFIEYLLHEVINLHKHEIFFAALGKPAQIAAKHLVPFWHTGLDLEHPAYAARKERAWDHNRVFTRANICLKDRYLDPIEWAYKSI